MNAHRAVNIALTIGLAVALAAILGSSHLLDDHSSEWPESTALQDAQRAARAEYRRDRAAQQLCIRLHGPGVVPSWDATAITANPLLTIAVPRVSVGSGSPVINRSSTTLGRDIYGRRRGANQHHGDSPRCSLHHRTPPDHGRLRLPRHGAQASQLCATLPLAADQARTADPARTVIPPNRATTRGEAEELVVSVEDSKDAIVQDVVERLGL